MRRLSARGHPGSRVDAVVTSSASARHVTIRPEARQRAHRSRARGVRCTSSRCGVHFTHACCQLCHFSTNKICRTCAPREGLVHELQRACLLEIQASRGVLALVAQAAPACALTRSFSDKTPLERRMKFRPSSRFHAAWTPISRRRPSRHGGLSAPGELGKAVPVSARCIDLCTRFREPSGLCEKIILFFLSCARPNANLGEECAMALRSLLASATVGPFGSQNTASLCLDEKNAR